MLSVLRINSLARSRLRGAPMAMMSRPFHMTASRFQASTLPKHHQRDPTSTAPIPLTPEQKELAKKLTWEEFLKMNGRRRTLDLATSIVTGMVGMTAGAMYVINLNIDPTQTVFGMDPTVAGILGILVAGGLGFVSGGVFSSGLFALFYRKKMPYFKAKNLDFLNHIKMNRVDPRSQSMNNPVPDYYGEKISSLKEYKQWLRDCNVYRKKAREFL